MSGFVNPAPWVPKAGTETDSTAVTKKSRMKILTIVGTVVLIVAICVGGGFGYVNHRNAVAAQQAEDTKAKVLRRAFTKCKYTKGQEESASIADNDRSLTYSSGDDGVVRLFNCVVESLKMPQSTLSKINATSGLSGTQEDQWDNIKITWSYNANIGLNAVFELEN